MSYDAELVAVRPSKERFKRANQSIKELADNGYLDEYTASFLFRINSSIFIEEELTENFLKVIPSLFSKII